MAKQLNFSAGQVIPTALHTEMQQSYLEYAMSVIVGRALPDVRDGLKPVHRRILYAMHELGLTPDRPYRKCARVVGDVLGKYHPHGDQAVYDALVRLVQDFSSRYPLLGGHGNFGSIDDDPPAAMRYTETRLAAIGNEAMLTEIGEDTVDFVGNFDNSQQEPVVLPAQLPILLLNGSSGIAVGMATNIPPHNLNEIVDALIALIDSPNLSDERLLEIVPGPDFPTGAEMIGNDGIRDAYLNGRGSITMRGVANIEEIFLGKGRHRRNGIIITELPYQVCKANWIEKVAELVTQGKLDGIADIRDESDREGIRVVIEVKRDINPQKILAQLFKQTALQSNFGVILLAIDDGQPRQFTLRDMLTQFLSFREHTLTRRYQYELTKAESRLHVLDAMLIALENLDEVIDILRNAPDGSSAKAQLNETFEFSDRQSDAILSMPLRRLTGMERENLQTEFDELTAKAEDLRKLLGDRRELMKALKKDLRSLKKQFGDDRRTRIIPPLTSDIRPTKGNSGGSSKTTQLALESAESAPASSVETYSDFTEVQEVVVEISQKGYIRRSSTKAFDKRANKPGDAAPGILEEQEDPIAQTEFTTTAETLVVLTRSGKAYPINVGDIPPMTSGKGAKGSALINLLPPVAQSEGVTGSFILSPELDLENTFILLLTEQGRIKRLSLSELNDMNSRGLTVIKCKEDDQLSDLRLSAVGELVVIATTTGRVLRLAVNDDSIPVMNRTTQGLRAMRLGKSDRLVGFTTLPADGGNLLFVSEEGYVKRMSVNQLRVSLPGEIGTQGFLFSKRTDRLVGLIDALPETEVLVTTSTNRQGKILPEDLDIESKDGKGVKLIKLQADERVVNAREL
jgi:DNA gyrase subunit A